MKLRFTAPTNTGEVYFAEVTEAGALTIQTRHAGIVDVASIAADASLLQLDIMEIMHDGFDEEFTVTIAKRAIVEALNDNTNLTWSAL
jgi:hypothetical protein